MESRKRVGAWEDDTIVGMGLMRVVTLIERKTGLLRMRLVPNGEADAVIKRGSKTGQSALFFDSYINSTLTPVSGGSPRWSEKRPGRAA